jgi:histidinol dehydrogenase
LVWNSEISALAVAESLPRATQDLADVTRSVEKIIQDVRSRGSAALLEQAKEFDGVSDLVPAVSHSAIQAALRDLDPGLREAIEEAIRRVRLVSSNQLPKPIETSIADGSDVTLRFQAIDSVGVYVPGGKAVYPSSVIMNVVPAQVAGVRRIAIASPAQHENQGLPDPTVLATAALLGIEEVYSIGGAGAIAAMAVGVSEIGLEPVHMVTGPGNIFVATAKRILSSRVAIDAEAGPTEILIVADDSANPAWIAADLISQAEHDENAAAVLVTDSESLISKVEAELSRQVETTPNKERVMAALNGYQSALVLTQSMDDAARIADYYASEHLEIHTRSDESVMDKISNAGAIFLGGYSPVSVGDYLAGSNHVLPTRGQATRSAGLSVYSFLRPQHVVRFDRACLAGVVEQLEIFSNAEGLPGHGAAGRIRFES